MEKVTPMKDQQTRRLAVFALCAAGLVAVLLLGAGCHLYNLEKKLSPDNAEFLSYVRYIITPEERKAFLEMPDSQKPQFIEEFWKKRDTDPDTPENEFRTEYDKRIQKANELFRGEGRPGWLTDRGRIYILFGPPMDRIVNPPSVSGRERCTEVWYYGQFPVVFRDESCTGNYVLVTYDLTSLRETNLAYMSTLNEAQDQAQRTIQPNLATGKSAFDFEWQVEKKVVSPDRVEGLVTVEVPVAKIWFKSVGDVLATDLTIELQLKDSQGKVYWERKETETVSTTEQKLKGQMRDKVRKEIPFVFDQDLERLRAGKNQFVLVLKNATGNETVRKTTPFTL
jgi:GWxTD domain-containing protein